MKPSAGLGWLGIARLGLVQTALGAVVVLTTSTLNRVMVVEYALPAVLPGLLVALHYAVQMARPRFGHGSDVGLDRTRWIVGGMAALACGGVGAALATTWLADSPVAGLVLAAFAYAAIGLGVGAAGTSLLVLMATLVAPARRAPAATIMWIMMIAGFAITSAIAGHFLDPFSPARLVAVSAATSAIACALACLAIRGVEARGRTAGTAGVHAATTSRASAASRAVATRDADGRNAAVVASAAVVERAAREADRGEPATRFRAALHAVWSEPTGRRFTIFVFASMLAYSAQDLILEPFAGLVFGWTPGATTQLSGVQHGGTMLGMIVVALAGSSLARGRAGSLRAWMIGGCLGSAAALCALVLVGHAGLGRALAPSVFVLGASNGAFAVAAIGSMMELASSHHDGREGVRMGLWGAAQAIAFGIGGLVGAAAVDVARAWLGAPVQAYGLVFGAEALLFVVSARLAARLDSARDARAATLRDFTTARTAEQGGAT
jgi:BCD family chlorophyll transporter-like MFS transporter